MYKDKNYQPLKVEICHSSPPAFPWDPHMLRIGWETSIEPAKMVEDQPESAQLIEAYMTKKAAALAYNATKTDLGLTEINQQSVLGLMHRSIRLSTCSQLSGKRPTLGNLARNVQPLQGGCG